MFSQFRFLTFVSKILASTLTKFMVWIVLGVIVAVAIAGLTVSFEGNKPHKAPIATQTIATPTTVRSTMQSTNPSTHLIDWSQTWVVDASEAKSLLEHDDTILLDARGISRRILTHIAGAIPVHWRDFSQLDASHAGKLLPYHDRNYRQALEQKIRNLGISEQTIVLVYGEPIHGWGEEGRIVWMLKTLGHASVALIDGGIDALIESGLETSVLPSYTLPAAGHFRIQPRSDWTVQHEQVRSILDSSDGSFQNSAHVSLVDTREAREYRGATPYGEQRGGHVPGAVHIYFKQLLSDNGRLKSPQEIQDILRTHNISLDSEVIAYCTGGIRSAWFVSVLSNMGYVAKNYPGSMWEWSTLPVDEYPLDVTPNGVSMTR